MQTAKGEVVERIAAALWNDYGYDAKLGSLELAGLGDGRAREAAARCRRAAESVYQSLRGFDAGQLAEALSGEPPVSEEVNVLQPIHVWADGSGSQSDSPAGAGYVIRYHDAKPRVVGFGVPLGKGTSNVAELSAILKALESIPVEQRTRPVRVTSDSQYALGAASGRNKVNANGPLVFELRRLAKTFRTIEWLHCKGHSGVPENEACDRLAGIAAREQRVVQLHEVARGS